MTISRMSHIATTLDKICFAVYSEFCRVVLELQFLSSAFVFVLFFFFLYIPITDSVHDTDSDSDSVSDSTLAPLTYFLSCYTAPGSLFASCVIQRFAESQPYLENYVPNRTRFQTRITYIRKCWPYECIWVNSKYQTNN